MAILIFCALILELLLAIAAWFIVRAGNEPSGAMVLLPVLLMAFIPYGVAVWRARAVDWRRAGWFILAVAVIGRATLWPTPLLLSDDAYRYFWEGKVQAAGFNPYRHGPDSPKLARLRDAAWEQVQHREVPSAYPPLALLMFRFGAFVSSTPWVFKLIFTAFDLACLWVLIHLLRIRGQNESLSLIWAWNPLVMVEFAGSAHSMSAAIFFLLTGLWLLHRCTSGKIMAAAGLAFAAAILSHFFAILLTLAAVLANRVKNRWFWLSFSALVIGGFAIFADAGAHLMTGLANFAGRWRFNGSIFEALVTIFDDGTAHRMFGNVWWAYPGAKFAATGILVGVFVWMKLRRYDPIRAALTAAGAILLLSPTVHPWYVTWIVAIVCLEFRYAWLAFSGLVLISYATKLAQLQTGVWTEFAAVRWLEYMPLFALLVTEWWRKRFDSGILGR